MEHGPAREAAALPRLMREELARWAGARAVAWKDDGVGEAEAVTDVPAVATATTAAAEAEAKAAAAAAKAKEARMVMAEVRAVVLPG